MSVNSQDIIRVDAIALFNEAETVVNSWQFRYEGVPAITEADLLDDINDILQILYTLIKAVHTSITIWQRFRAENLTQGVVYGETPINPTIAGTATGDPNAPGVAALMYFGTAVPHVQMRKYLGPLAETHVSTGGRIGGAITTTLVNLGLALLDPITVNGRDYSYGYLSSKTGTFILPSSATYTLVPAYQRRRKQGRGS